MTLQTVVADFCRRHGKQQIWVGFSGGLDSSVLLDLCHRAAQQDPSLSFQVIHVHHGLSPEADAWAKHCAVVCERYGFQFHLVTIQLSSEAKESLEERARAARYRALATFMQPNDLLLTAHHQRDQAETVLLQLLRGSGIKGLAAMPALKPFHQGWQGRPLLAVPHKVLLEYATENQLSWIEDESNQQSCFTRNFIRQHILPVMQSRWPTVDAVLARSASHCAEAEALLQEAALEKLTQVSGSIAGTLSVQKLQAYSSAWQRLLLRSWIVRQGYRLPDTDKMQSIQQSVLGAAQDRQPQVSWQGVSLKRHQDNLHLVSENTPLPEAGKGLKLDQSEVVIRCRIPGETVEIANRGRIALKNLFQEWRVPAWERNTLPLMFYHNKLIQVPGYFEDPVYF